MCDKEIVVCAAIWVQDHKNKPHGPVNIVSHKPKEERRMMFICGDDIASIIKRFENESK